MMRNRKPSLGVALNVNCCTLRRCLNIIVFVGRRGILNIIITYWHIVVRISVIRKEVNIVLILVQWIVILDHALNVQLEES